jgi:Icc-related predicted phosphoesterase/uncharacterized protein YprB with RNaseH-like and TPR domain
MRLLAFSDWRVQEISDVLDFARNLKKPVDFILYAGDDVERFSEGQNNYFEELSAYARQKKVLGVIGNDDLPYAKRVLAGRYVHDLHEGPFFFEDLAFIGIEGCTSGPAIVKYSEAEVRKHLQEQLAQIKEKKLVVLSHTPPHGVLDIGIRFAHLDKGSHHIGSTALRNFIRRNNATLSICGHCHSHGGHSAQYMNTTVVNVSSHDSPGAKGNFAVVEFGPDSRVRVDWHDTTEGYCKDSLFHLHGIGPARESRLSEVGITTIREMSKTHDLNRTAVESGFSLNFLRKLQLQARAVLENQVYQLKPFIVPKERLIFFDIETDLACRKIWLIGVLDGDTFVRFYADNWKKEKTILRGFLDFLKERVGSTLVTYSANNFDLNVTLRALSRLRIDTAVLGAFQHLNLCQALRNSFIFPNQSFALKHFGTFLNYPFRHPDLDGLLVALAYGQHLRDRKPLGRQFFEYNEDDVRVLPFIFDSTTRLKVKRITLDTRLERVNRTISADIEEEVAVFEKLREKGHTLQQIADQFGRSIYYVYSRLKPKYRPWSAYKPLDLE